jgi:hypothetical protein
MMMMMMMMMMAMTMTMAVSLGFKFCWLWQLWESSRFDGSKRALKVTSLVSTF